MKKHKKLPVFKNVLQEAEFWRTHDSTDYIDWKQAKPVSFSRLKPSTKTISLRLPEALLNEIKILANKEDIPYQSLMKMLLSHGVHSFR